MNNEFFNNPSVNHTIKVYEHNPLDLYFGTGNSSRQIVCNDVNIIPDNDSIVEVSLKIEGMDEITINIYKEINIYQRTSKTYGDMNLFF